MTYYGNSYDWCLNSADDQTGISNEYVQLYAPIFQKFFVFIVLVTKEAWIEVGTLFKRKQKSSQIIWQSFA